MSDEDKVEETIVTPENDQNAANNAHENDQNTQIEPETTVSLPKQDKVTKDKEYNFAELRKRTEAAERERDYERKRNSDILEMYKGMQKPTTAAERDLLEEELGKLQKDDLATIDNVDKKLTRAERNSSKKVDTLQQKIDALEAKIEQQQLYVKYPDLDQVLSSENIAALKEEDPEIAEMIGSLPKGSSQQAMMAYKYIKKLVPQKTIDFNDKKQALDNLAKPRSIQSIKTPSPIGQASGWDKGVPTKNQASAAYKEMLEAMKRG
jgi:hypothetical protein